MTETGTTTEARGADSRSKPGTVAGSHDTAKRRRSKRSQRERGCWTYIPAEELLRAGIDPEGPPPFYRTWGTSRGGVMVRLYREG